MLPTSPRSGARAGPNGTRDNSRRCKHGANRCGIPVRCPRMASRYRERIHQLASARDGWRRKGKSSPARGRTARTTTASLRSGTDISSGNGSATREWTTRSSFRCLMNCMTFLRRTSTISSHRRESLSKERVGAKWKIKREQSSLTPYERVMGRYDIAPEAKEKAEDRA